MKQEVGSLRTDPSHPRLAGVPLLHGPTLAQLLQCLGPTRAATFLDQMQTDLTSALNALRIAADLADRPGMQRASHILMALAGTLGATELEKTARALNVDAQGAIAARLDDMASAVAAMTARLVTELGTKGRDAQPPERPDR
jgi:HPt (histidine-containing phosphotransfer) domain-containing protein